MAELRRKILPPCPHCHRPAALASHRDNNCGGDLHVDIEVGIVHCVRCHSQFGFEDTTHYCSCGCVYTGGELWAGMATQFGRFRQLAWVARAGITRGSLTSTIIKIPTPIGFMERFRRSTIDAVGRFIEKATHIIGLYLFKLAIPIGVLWAGAQTGGPLGWGGGMALAGLSIYLGHNIQFAGEVLARAVGNFLYGRMGGKDLGA